MNHLIGTVRAAIDKYKMIAENDKIAVCVSGGKDSVFLLYALNAIKRYYPIKFDIVAISVDPGFNNSQTDFSSIENLCQSLNIKYVIKRTQLATIIFDVRKEDHPCSLCAKMRRGILHNMALELGCNKIALGHNLEDATETFIMNLFDCGNIGCFAPVAYLSRKNIHMIRPLIFCNELKIKNFIAQNGLPIVQSECPVNGLTNRQKAKNLIEDLKNQYPDLNKKIIGAMQRFNVDDWGKNFF